MKIKKIILLVLVLIPVINMVSCSLNPVSWVSSSVPPTTENYDIVQPVDTGKDKGGEK